MKKVAPILLAFIFATFFVACKDESKSETPQETDDLAVADTTSETTPDYLYVTASSGLTLREFANLQSEKVAVMPYGTKVKVVTPESNATMNVGGIKGGMHEVEFNHKTGYAFNGYLSKFFPPEEDMKAVVYAEELKAAFQEVSFTATSGGSASNPTNTETLLLPTNEWHEAFYIAKQLFNIPTEFAFPNPKGSNEEIVKETKPKSGTWTSELSVARNNDTLEKITYSYRTEGYGYEVTISEEGDKMKIENKSVAD